jgi:hypothetical protein
LNAMTLGGMKRVGIQMNSEWGKGVSR